MGSIVLAAIALMLAVGCSRVDPTGEWAGGIGIFTGKIVVNRDGTATIDRAPAKWKMVEKDVLEFEAEGGLDKCRFRISEDGKSAVLTSPNGMVAQFSRYK